MGRIILITGGARSGKSTYAEETALKIGGSILYVATSIPFDDEMKARVQKHRERRPSGWSTLEAYKDMDEHLRKSLEGKSGVLLDCITVMVTNLVLEVFKDIDHIQPEEIEEAEAYAGREITRLLEAARRAEVPFILVTNEVGMGIVPEYPSGRVFRDVCGRINQVLARAADEVYFCVSGIPMKIKG